MKSAIIDWLVLSRSALIINTYGSSFAVEASQVRNIPLVGVWGGNYIYTNDAKMPYCGHLQFIKHYSNQGIKTTYREGTSDNREIKATQLLLKPCGVLKNVHYLMKKLLNRLYN